MKIKISHKKYTEKKIVNNILDMYNKSTNDDKLKDWYLNTHNFAVDLSLLFNVHLSKVCGIIAALSPLKHWDQNKECAMSFFETGNGLQFYNLQQKCRDILQASNEKQIANILNGQKITAFFWNIRQPYKDNIVTIDRHAISIALNCRTERLTPMQYKFIENCYIKASEKLNITASLLQSITWVTFRKLNN